MRAATGVFSLLVVAAFSVLLARGIRLGLAADREWTVGAFAALAGWVAALATHFTSPSITPFFCLLAGSLLANSAPVASVVRRRVMVAAAVVMTVFTGLAAVAEIPLRQGIVALNQGDGAAAGDSLRTALVVRPWDADLDLAVAHAALTVAAAVGALPSVPLARTAQGRHFLVTGDLDRAAAAVDEVLRLSPNDPQA